MRRLRDDEWHDGRSTLALEIKHREHDGIEILDLTGRLTMGEEDIVFRETLQRLTEQGQRKIVLVCKQLEELDSVGTGTLIWVHQTLEKLGGSLALAGVKVEHLDLFVVLKLEAFFAVFDTENDAVNSFFPERQVERVDVLKLVRTLMKPEKTKVGEIQK